MGKTILISSHILSELADCCTSIGIIERGQLLMHGPIDDVYRRIHRNRQIEIKFLDGMDAGLSIIRSMPEIRDVQMKITVSPSRSTPTTRVARLLDEFTRQGVQLRSFNDKDPTLEDVFMLVTKGLVS